MPRISGISHEARARALLELRAFQQLHPEGCTLTRLNQRLGWKTKDTTRVVDDLVSSEMVYGEYVSDWARTHEKSSILSMSGGYLLTVSHWGDEFLKHWDELDRLSTARDHHYEP